MRYVYLVTAFVVALTVSILGFRGRTFTQPPMDVFPEWAFPGMKHQPKYRPQGASAFFADGRADRPLPAHVVARDDLRLDDHLYYGKNAAGGWARGFPAGLNKGEPLDIKFLERGRERYAIYCAPCHGASGDGKGVTNRYGMSTTPSYHDDRFRQMPEGEIYNTIVNGSPNKVMLPYADKLSPDDRWAVVAYIRALQRASAPAPQTPPAKR